jgi:hypothetical protein
MRLRVAVDKAVEWKGVDEAVEWKGMEMAPSGARLWSLLRACSEESLSGKFWTQIRGTGTRASI